jgi:hypothetical protein
VALFAALIIFALILPQMGSIIAMCSRLSWVWNNASPVQNSTRMQPIDHISHGKLHPQPGVRKVLSEGFTKDDLWSTIMPSTHQVRMILIVECRASEID